MGTGNMGYQCRFIGCNKHISSVGYTAEGKYRDMSTFTSFPVKPNALRNISIN